MPWLVGALNGTLLNTAAVLLGATVGTLLGDRLPARLREIALQAVGLITLLLGMQMALQAHNTLVVLASLVLGGLLGEALAIERHLDGLGAALERRFGDERSASSATAGEPGGSRFVRGFVTSSLVFCVGPMTILGSLQNGLTGDLRLLAVKSLLDGFTSIALASALGRGVFLSAGVVLVVQGALALAGTLLSGGLPDPRQSPALIETTAVGGLLILGIGLRLLEIRPIRVGNLLPALALAPLLTVLVGPFLDQLLSTAR